MLLPPLAAWRPMNFGTGTGWLIRIGSVSNTSFIPDAQSTVLVCLTKKEIQESSLKVVRCWWGSGLLMFCLCVSSSGIVVVSSVLNVSGFEHWDLVEEEQALQTNEHAILRSK